MRSEADFAILASECIKRFCRWARGSSLANRRCSIAQLPLSSTSHVLALGRRVSLAITSRCCVPYLLTEHSFVSFCINTQFFAPNPALSAFALIWILVHLLNQTLFIRPWRGKMMMTDVRILTRQMRSLTKPYDPLVRRTVELC